MDEQQYGLVHALVLDGQGGARQLAHAELAGLQLQAQESLWLHWDRGHPGAQQWLRQCSGLSAFACNLLLEESTRPRLLPLSEEQLLLFLRGVNLNPGAEPEDMVSVRVFVEPQRLLSLRLRPLRVTEKILAQLVAGQGPCHVSDLLLALARGLTEHVDELLLDLGEAVDDEEERVDASEQYRPNHDRMQQLRRRAAALRRFLAPQRELYQVLLRNHRPWFAPQASDYWNELHNQLTRHLEELELMRERISLILESEHRRMSERMGRTMYLLGIITGFFLPLSFLTGLLGINVGGIPGAETEYAFYAVCSLFVLLALGQWWLFRRLRWL